MPITLDSFIGYFGVIGGLAGLAALIVAFATRREKKANYMKTVSEAVSGLIEPLQNRIKNLEDEIEFYKSINNELNAALTRRDSTIDDFNRKFAMLELENKRKSLKILELENSMQEMTNDNIRKETEINQLSKDVQEFRKQLQERDQEIKRLRKLIKDNNDEK